jgi:hypothetical protein
MEVLMEDLESALLRGMVILGRQIDEAGIANLVTVEEDYPYLRLKLHRERSTIFIGFARGNGYFLVSQKGAVPSAYFELTKNVISGLLPGISPSDPGLSPTESPVEMAAVVLEAITSEEPDVSKLESFFDNAGATDAGIHMISVVSAIYDRRRAISKLVGLIESPSCKERELQDLIADEPWMLGAQYQRVIAKESLIEIGVRVDLLLQNVLGYMDVVEFKLPKMELLVWDGSGWKQSAGLSGAYSQALRYIRIIDENRSKIENLIHKKRGVSRMYRSGVLLVAGRTPPDPDAQDMLRDINANNHRIVLMTYDEVVSIAESTLSFFERHVYRQRILQSSGNVSDSRILSH